MTSLAQQLEKRRCGFAFSSGFFGFYHHAGVYAALAERHIVPVQLSGTSAGAIVSAMVAAGMEAEQIKTALFSLTRKQFWDIQFPFGQNGFGWLKGDRFGATLASHLPNHGFSTLNTRLNLGVFDLETGWTTTVESGSLIDGVRASCAVPYLFEPVRIGQRRYWDGGLAEKVPLTPFIESSDVDTVVISMMPPREEAPNRKAAPFFARLPLLAYVPLSARIERHRVLVDQLKKAGKQVVTINPGRIWLGPRELHKGPQAYLFAYQEASRLLDAPVPLSSN